MSTRRAIRVLNPAWGESGPPQVGTMPLTFRALIGLDGEAKTRFAGTGFSVLSRLWYRAELLHHAEHVHFDPALHDLALDHPVYGMT
jgi:hypothetical protein